MLNEVKYKASEFIENLETLEGTFKVYQKLQSFLYKTTNTTLYYPPNAEREDYVTFYCKFAKTRVKNVLTAFKELFLENSFDIEKLNEGYDLNVVYKPIDEEAETILLKIDSITLTTEYCVDDIEITKGLDIFLKTPALQDQNIINYLINLDKCVKEIGEKPWTDWVIDNTISTLIVANIKTEPSSGCFSNLNQMTDSILEEAITDLELLAFRLADISIGDVDNFAAQRPLVYNAPNEISQQHKQNVTYLEEQKKLKPNFLKKITRLISDGISTDKAIKFILQNLNTESFQAILKEASTCIPGFLTIEDLISSILDGSFELISEGFFNDIYDSLPPEVRSYIEAQTKVTYPWEEGANEFSFLWFEALLKDIDKGVSFYAPKHITLESAYQWLDPLNYPSTMYYILKLYFGPNLEDVDFRKRIGGDFGGEEGFTLEEYAAATFGRTTLNLNISYGQKNNDVLLLQVILNGLGVKDNKGKPLEEDRKFGKKTKQAVKNFQRNNKDSSGTQLKIDGIVGPLTYSALQPEEGFKSIFNISTLDFERFYLELYELSLLVKEFPELEVAIKDVISLHIPMFEFAIPYFGFPSFREREITGRDFEDIYNFINVYYPQYNYDTVQVGENILGHFSTLPEGDEEYFNNHSILEGKGKASFFKIILETIMSDPSALPVEAGQEQKTMRQVFDSLFFNVKQPGAEYETILGDPALEEYYSKLYGSMLLKHTQNLLANAPVDITSFLTSADFQQTVFEKFHEIPEIKAIINNIVPEIAGFPTIDINGFSPSLPDFPKEIKLPDIPLIPDINFNLMEYISEKLFKVLKNQLTKIFIMLITRIAAKITDEVCGDPQSGDLQKSNNKPDGGLGAIINDIVCSDNKSENNTSVLINSTLGAMTTQSYGIESVEKLVNSLAVCATKGELAPAILGDKDRIAPGFANKMANVVNASTPELADVLGSPDQISEFFERAGGLLDETQRQSVRDIIEEGSDGDSPVNPTICLSNEELDNWANERQQIFEGSGFDPDIASEFIDRQRNRAKEDYKDIINAAASSPEDLFSSAIDDILNPDDEDCSPLINPPEIQEVLQQSSSDLLASINTVLIEDMVKENFFFGDFSGAISRILSDRYGRSTSEISFLKRNFLTNMLITFGQIPAPDYPETVFLDLTKSMADLEYSFGDEEFTTPEIIDKPLFSIPILNSIKRYFASRSYIAPSIIFKYKDNTAVEYMDHSVLDKINDGIKIDLDFIYPNKDYMGEFLEKYSSLGFDKNTKPIDVFYYLFGEEYVDQYEALQKGTLDILKDLFGADVLSGFPTEITADDLKLTGGDNQNKILAVQENITASDRVAILDPEIYGGSYTNPKIFIKPPDPNSEDGFYGYSKKLFSDNDEEKNNRTVLKLDSIAQYIDSVKNKIDDSKCRKCSKFKFVLESPYDVMLPKEKISHAWGYIKILIRVYIAEYLTLAYPVVKKMGCSEKNYSSLMFGYIMHRIEKDLQEFKDPFRSADVYSYYVCYILILEQMAQEHMTLFNDAESKYFKERRDTFIPLSKNQVQGLLENQYNSKILSLEDNYLNFVRGYAVLSFGANWKSVMDSSFGFKINCYNFTEQEIRFANKVGYIAADLDPLKNLMMKSIEQQFVSYNSIFAPEINDIAEYFVQSDFGLGVSLEDISWQPNISGYSIKKYFLVTDKSGQEQEYSHEELLDYLEQFDSSLYISNVLGNAKILSVYDNTYEGTIGIKLGLMISYKDREIARYEKDVKDYQIFEVYDSGPHLGEDISCYVKELMKTDNMDLLLNYALKVKKIGTLAGIHFMRNSLSSVRKDPDETPLVPFLDIDFAGLLFDSCPLSVYTKTKKEVISRILSFYKRESSDPKEEIVTYSDYQQNQTINANFDKKTLKINGLDAVPFFKRFLITDNIPLDKDGNPLVSKFLQTHFSEED